MNKEILTLEKLKELPPNGIFASGSALVEDYWDASKEMLIDWVACRGGIHDWAIYYKLQIEGWSESMIKSNGDKMHNPKSIQRCVPADDEAMDMYRH